MSETISPTLSARNHRATVGTGHIRRYEDDVDVATVSRALIDPLTNEVVAYIDINGNLVGAGGTPLTPVANIVVQHADGTSTGYVPTADTDAERGTALAAAKAAAVSGERIYVGVGAYTVSASLAKTGVRWAFALGAVVTLANNTDDVGIWDDGGVAMTVRVEGNGTFIRTSASGAFVHATVFLRHASSNFSIDADSIQSSSVDGSRACVRQNVGTLSLNVRELVNTGSTAAYGIWWFAGPCYATVDKITSTDQAIYLSTDTALMAGDFFLNVQEIVGSVNMLGTSATHGAWIDAKVINATATAQDESVHFEGGGRLYVHAQKLYGKVNSLFAAVPGLMYLVTDKIVPDTDGSMITISDNTCFIDVTHMDPDGSDAAMVAVSSNGVLNLNNAQMTGANDSLGMTISGGTARLTNVRINTAANASTNPITKSGGTLILQGVILVAEGTRDSIEATGAQDVVAYGSFANKAVDATGPVTITITGGLVIDADVV